MKKLNFKKKITEKPTSKGEVPTDKAAKNFGPVSALLVTLLAFLGSQLLAGIIIGAFISISGRDVETVLKSLTESTFGEFLFILTVEVFALAILYWFIKWRGITFKEIGLGRGPQWRDVGLALACFGVYFVLAAITLAIVNMVLPDVNLDQEQQIGFESAESAGALALVFISLVILPPITEEIMIRGFLYSGLRRKYTRLISALLASVVFGIAHLQLGAGAPPLYVAAIDTFVLSMVLIGLREVTGSLWAGMMVHAAKNGLAFVALFILNIA